MNPVYQHADVSIYHGNCTNVLPQLNIEADLILTSPPYDNLRSYGGYEFDFDAIADSCVESLAEGGVIVWVVGDATVNGSETGNSFKQALGFMERGLRLHDTMIYQRKHNASISSTRYFQWFEYMFVLSKGAPKTVNLIEDKTQRDRRTKEAATSARSR